MRRGRRSKVEPTIVIAWDPDVFSPEEYAELIGALGDIARVHGAEGVKRIVSESINIDAAVGAFA
jgi:hypothetical protein